MHCDFADLLSCWAHSLEQNGSNGKDDQHSHPFHPLQRPVPRAHSWSAIFLMFYITIFDTTPHPGIGQPLVLALQHEVSSDLKSLRYFCLFITSQSNTASSTHSKPSVLANPVSWPAGPTAELTTTMWSKAIFEMGSVTLSFRANA